MSDGHKWWYEEACKEIEKLRAERDALKARVEELERCLHCGTSVKTITLCFGCADALTPPTTGAPTPREEPKPAVALACAGCETMRASADEDGCCVTCGCTTVPVDEDGRVRFVLDIETPPTAPAKEPREACDPNNPECADHPSFQNLERPEPCPKGTYCLALNPNTPALCVCEQARVIPTGKETPKNTRNAPSGKVLTAEEIAAMRKEGQEMSDAIAERTRAMKRPPFRAPTTAREALRCVCQHWHAAHWPECSFCGCQKFTEET